MDVVEILRRASEVVERSGVADDLRSVAFSTAVDLLLKGPSAAVRTPAVPPAVSPVAPLAPAGSWSDVRPGHVERSTRPAPSGRPHAWADADAGSSGGHGAADGRDRDHGRDHAWDRDRNRDHDREQDPDDDAEAPSASVSRLGPVPAHRSSGPGAGGVSGVGGVGGGGRPVAPAPTGRTLRNDRLVAVGPPRGPAAVPDDPWGHIADALGVRPELLDRVWEERGGRLQLAGDPARLGRTRAQRVGTAAVLLLAALRWSGRDAGEPVPDAVVRAEVERLGLLDTGNYTKHLAGRRQVLSMTGSGRGATYKLRYDGLEEARAIAHALLDDA